MAEVKFIIGSIALSNPSVASVVSSHDVSCIMRILQIFNGMLINRSGNSRFTALLRMQQYSRPINDSMFMGTLHCLGGTNA